MNAQPLETARGTFVHDALFYEGIDAFVEQVGGFVRAGQERGDLVAVLVGSAKAHDLADHLGADARNVEFLDRAVLGTNPARLIPILREHHDAARATGRGVTAVGEPVWSGQDPATHAESERHEALVNLAFEGSDELFVMCPYDVGALPSATLEEAMRNHPVVVDESGRHASTSYAAPERGAPWLQGPLTDAVAPVSETYFTADAIGDVRAAVERRARRFGLTEEQVADVCLASHELVTNSVRHGGGEGLLRTWTEDAAFVVEVSDGGTLLDPLVGRQQPDQVTPGGRGLWLVNQLCDLVQLRSGSRGTVVRISMYRRP